MVTGHLSLSGLKDPTCKISYFCLTHILDALQGNFEYHHHLYELVWRSGKELVAWDEVFCPLEEGGLGIRRMEEISKACMMKLAWCCLTSNYPWAAMCRNRYLKDGAWSANHPSSSYLWKGKRLYVKGLSSWFIGNGSSMEFLNEGGNLSN